MPPEVVTKTPMPPSLGPETKITTSLRTWGVIIAITVSGTMAWLSTPSTEDARLIAETAAKAVDAAQNQRRTNVDSQLAVLAQMQATSERDRKELVSAIDRLDDKMDGVLILTAERRGPISLRKVKRNLAMGAKPTNGVIEE